MRYLLRYPPHNPHCKYPQCTEAIRVSDPSTFQGGGFRCTSFPLEDGGGWHNVCDQGDRHISFFFTP
jgi:hypothetical protein